MNCNLQIMVTLIKESWNLECGNFLRLLVDGHGSIVDASSHSIKRCYLEQSFNVI